MDSADAMPAAGAEPAGGAGPADGAEPINVPPIIQQRLNFPVESVQVV